MWITTIPISILSNRQLAPLEALSLYLKEKRLTNHQIAEALKRDDRTIWTVLHRAEKKKETAHKVQLSVTDQEVPLSLFHDRDVSALEAVAYFLHTLGFTFHQIAELLQRDDRTIWTSVQRYKKKKGELT